jgi:ABC-type polysaccharide/polyol phosphate transport system ATPase subunit
VAVHPDAVQVRDLTKTFRVPIFVNGGGGRRLLRHLSGRAKRDLRVLEDISFDVKKGEFFAVAGRNGSGKSTLLKLLAGIHAFDAGTIKIAGQVGPFLELGVGFNTELSTRENVVLNGVMLGRTPDKMTERLDSILEFAELEQFADAKLKQFSSGMRLRLAFSVMVQANPDVYLFDEVMAVGDAAFQEKASATFSDLKERGKTVVLVTHSMPAIEQLCDRAMLLEAGSIASIGATEEVTARYLEINHKHAERRPAGTMRPPSGDAEPAVSPRLRAELVTAQVGVRGAPGPGLEAGEPISLDAVVAVQRRIVGVKLWLELRDEHGVRFFANSTAVGDGWRDLDPGQKVRLHATLENRLAPGSYTLSWAVLHTAPNGVPVAVAAFDTQGFRVAGKRLPRSGPVNLSAEVALEPAGAKAGVARR